MSVVWLWVFGVVGYGCLVLCYAADRGRKYLRFIVPRWSEPYRLWLAGFVLIAMGLFVTAVEIGLSSHWVRGS